MMDPVCRPNLGRGVAAGGGASISIPPAAVPRGRHCGTRHGPAPHGPVLASHPSPPPTPPPPLRPRLPLGSASREVPAGIRLGNEGSREWGAEGERRLCQRREPAAAGPCCWGEGL